MPNGKLRCHKGQPVAQDCCTKGSGKEGGGRQTWRKPGGGSVVRLPCPHVVQLAGSQPALETFPGSLEEPAISSRFPRVIASIQAKAVAQGENPGCSQSSCLPKTPLSVLALAVHPSEVAAGRAVQTCVLSCIGSQPPQGPDTWLLGWEEPSAGPAVLREWGL